MIITNKQFINDETIYIDTVYTNFKLSINPTFNCQISILGGMDDFPFIYIKIIDFLDEIGEITRKNQILIDISSITLEKLKKSINNDLLHIMEYVSYYDDEKRYFVIITINEKDD